MSEVKTIFSHPELWAKQLENPPDPKLLADRTNQLMNEERIKAGLKPL